MKLKTFEIFLDRPGQGFNEVYVEAATKEAAIRKFKKNDGFAFRKESMIEAREVIPKSNSRTGLMANLAYNMGGHNASNTSCGRLALCVDVDDDEKVARYFYDEIWSDAQRPLIEEIIKLKALLFDLQNPK